MKQSYYINYLITRVYYDKRDVQPFSPFLTIKSLDYKCLMATRRREDIISSSAAASLVGRLLRAIKQRALNFSHNHKVRSYSFLFSPFVTSTPKPIKSKTVKS